jgi:hypothetical protein
MNDLLKEGGNVFKGADKQVLTRRITRDEIPGTIAYLEKVSGLDFTMDKDEAGVPIKWLGTTGRKTDSGDLDLSVDENEIDKDTLVQKLLAAGFDKGWIKKSGDSVHLMTPINGDKANGYAQTDFMFSPDTKWQQFSVRGGLEGSPYKGEHRHILLASIARAKGFKYSYKNGLVNAETNEVITKDPNQMAKMLLGQMAKPKDLHSMESILEFIKKLPNYEELVAAARETLGKQGIDLPESMIESYNTNWFRRMMDKIK